MRAADQRDLGLVFWLAYGSYRSALVRALAAAGFSDLREADATLLRYLHHADGATVTDLARLLQVSKQAASQHVASFVERGYGAREQSDADKRERVVRLTPRGRKARGAAIAFADQVEADLIAQVGPKAMATFRRVLDAFVTSGLDDAPEAIRIGAQMSSALE